MNFLIINHYAGSDHYGMEFRPLYLGRELVKLGHEVTVLAADHSHLRAVNPDIPRDFTEEWTDGVRYVWLKTPAYRKNDLYRFLNMASFLHKLKANSRKIYESYRPDVIVASSTYPYDVKAAQKIAAHGEKVRVCYEIHDVWPLSLIELYGLSPKNPYMRSLQKAENHAYRTVDLVISILPDVDRHICELGFEDLPYLHIPNGVVMEEGHFQPAPPHITEEIGRLHREGRFVLLYLGGFSKANALDDLLKAAEEMPDPVHLVLVGSGPLKAEYERIVREKRLTNVSILPLVTKLQVNRTLACADGLYIGAKRTPLYRFGVGMNKIFDYMLAERPILYAIEASNNPVQEADCGISIPPEDPSAIAEAAGRLAALPSSERERMGRNGRRYVEEHHDYRKLAERFAAAFDTDFQYSRHT